MGLVWLWAFSSRSNIAFGKLEFHVGPIPNREHLYHKDLHDPIEGDSEKKKEKRREKLGPILDLCPMEYLAWACDKRIGLNAIVAH
jgi:hypothetical protein